MKSWIYIALWIGVLSYNAIYSFLPSRLQTSRMRIFAIAAALLILFQGMHELIDKHNSRIYANVTRTGQITKSKNFRWEIIKSRNAGDGELIFMISDLHADFSQVSIVTSSPSQKYSLYNALGGVAIKFHISESDIRDFEINIKNAL